MSYKPCAPSELPCVSPPPPVKSAIGVSGVRQSNPRPGNYSNSMIILPSQTKPNVCFLECGVSVDPIQAHWNMIASSLIYLRKRTVTVSGDIGSRGSSGPCLGVATLKCSWLAMWGSTTFYPNVFIPWGNIWRCFWNLSTPRVMTQFAKEYWDHISGVGYLCPIFGLPCALKSSM